MKKLIMELIGTFFVVLTILAVITGPAIAGFGAIAIGVSFMVMIYCGGHISGAHYNPAVSMGLLSSGNLSGRDYIRYVLYQIIGAILAFVIIKILRPESTFSELPNTLSSALIAEGIWTFLLAFVVLNVAVATANKGNSFYGFAIGATILVGALVMGPISGGAFNPAVTIALATAGVLGWSTAILYLVVQLVAGAVAGILFKSLSES